MSNELVILDIANIVKDSGNVDLSRIDKKGFVLENTNMRLTYSRHDIFSNNMLYLVVLTSPVVRMLGNVRASKKDLEYSVSGIELLTCDPDSDEVSWIIAETELDRSVSLADLGYNENLYDWVKVMDALGKESRENNFLKPKPEWFIGATNYLEQAASSLGFVSTYRRWESQYAHLHPSDRELYGSRTPISDFFNGVLYKIKKLM